jgi:hypothetical protein
MMSKMTRTAMIILLAATALGCATKSDFIVLQEKDLSPYSFTLGELSLESIFSYENLKEELNGLVESLGNKHGFPITQNGASRYVMDITIRDKSFVSGLDTLHSLAVILEVKDESGLPVLRYYYAKDGTVPLDSFLAIYELVDESFLAFAEGLKQSYPGAP